MRFHKGSHSRKVVSVGIVFLSLAFVFYPLYFIALAQDEAPATAAEPVAAVEVSAEAQSAAEAEIASSAEVATEVSINLHEELGHPDYDGLVPADGLLGTLVYPLKEAAWNLQEGVYDLVASDATHAQLVSDHAELHVLDAVKQIAKDPDSYGTVAGILDEYKADVATVQDKIDEVAADDPTVAKTLAAEVLDGTLNTNKVLNTMVEGAVVAAPEVASQFIKIKNEVVESAGKTMINAAENEDQLVAAMNNIALGNHLTPFSGVGIAETINLMKENLEDELPSATIEALDKVVTAQLSIVEENIKGLITQASVEDVAKSFENYAKQLPGGDIHRVEVMDHFKSQAGLPPIFIEKCKEIQVKVSESIGAKIKSVVDETIKAEISKAFLEVKNPGVDDLKIMTAMKDFIPDPEIKKHMEANLDSNIARFRERFASDATAQQVTNEFEALTKKMQQGSFVPDPSYFKTMDNLYTRLAPEQQQFVNQMRDEGKKQMFERMQVDPLFVQRASTFNPQDVQVFDKLKAEFKSPEFGPSPLGFNFDAVFGAIEKEQAKNFGQFLKFQDDPEHVKAIQEHFQNFVPEEIRATFETKYNFGQETFKDFHKFAEEKHTFFQEKFGGGFPGTPGFAFPGGAPFGPGFPPPFAVPGVTPSPAPGFETGQYCEPPLVKGPYGCVYQFTGPSIQPITCSEGFIYTPFGCEPSGGIGTVPLPGPAPDTGAGSPYATPHEDTGGHDPATDCAKYGGTWTGSYCMFGTYQPPSTSYPTPSTSYPSPSTSYPTPSTSYPTPSTSYPTPSTSYSTPSTAYLTPTDYHPPESYPTPSTSYPTPSTSYPTPSTSYPTPSTSYPTPSTSYQTPSTSYPTPSTSYPTPAYGYPTPSTSYPTPTESYPTPAYAYPTPSYAYPTPTEYPTPAYAYPTPAYAYPTPTEYHTPHSYYPQGSSVAGVFTSQKTVDLGVFDVLAIFSLGVYGYLKKRKQGDIELE